MLQKALCARLAALHELHGDGERTSLARPRRDEQASQVRRRRPTEGLEEPRRRANEQGETPT